MGADRASGALRSLVTAGRLVVATEPGRVLTCAGLGSCVAVIVRAADAAVAGMAHVMLPKSPAADVDKPYRYADIAVPALIEAVRAELAAGHRIEALIAGGAFLPGLPEAGAIGARNLEAVTAALRAEDVPLADAATAGRHAQTVAIELSAGNPVTVREAGGRIYALGS